MGAMVGGPPPDDASARQRFANSLDRLLTVLTRRQAYKVRGRGA